MATILSEKTSAATLDAQPDTSSPSTASSCLARLVHNPMFVELQKTLANDCQHSAVPFTLLQNSPDCREPHSPGKEPHAAAADDNDDDDFSSLSQVDLIVEEATLQAEFRQLAPLQDTRVAELETFYLTQSAAIVTRRLDTASRIDAAGYPASRKQYELHSANAYYDRQHVHLTMRVSKSLELLKCLFALELSPSAVTSHGHKKKSRLLDQRAVSIMHQWYDNNVHHPYPSDEQKADMATRGCISLAQVKAWFANKRNRTLNTRPKRQRTSIQQQSARELALRQQLVDLNPMATTGRPNYAAFLSEMSQLVTDKTAEMRNATWEVGNSTVNSMGLMCGGVMQEVT